MEATGWLKMRAGARKGADAKTVTQALDLAIMVENRCRQSDLSLFINKRLPVAAMLFLGHDVPSLCGCMKFQYGRKINTARMIRKWCVDQTLTFTLTLKVDSSMVFSQQSK
ncbi:MAG: hypothetical protein MUO68_04555, partial [Desulfobacteraceae bacterium]|nr:hypothetical protein [Desulfobacteraceae bacterium]